MRPEEPKNVACLADANFRFQVSGGGGNIAWDSSAPQAQHDTVDLAAQRVTVIDQVVVLPGL